MSTFFDDTIPPATTTPAAAKTKTPAAKTTTPAAAATNDGETDISQTDFIRKQHIIEFENRKYIRYMSPLYDSALFDPRTYLKELSVSSNYYKYKQPTINNELELLRK